MTITSRYLADLKDLLSLHLACGKCSASMTIPFAGGTNYVPDQCPYCHERWMVPNSTDNKQLFALFDALKTLKELDKGKTTFKLSVEIAPPVS